MSVQINTTIARHNAHQLPDVLELANLSAPTHFTPSSSCRSVVALTLPPNKWFPPEEYEKMLNWFYDRSLEGGIEMKATCAPHYFRVVRQRRVAEHRSEEAAAQAAQPVVEASVGAPHIGPTEMLMPGSTGMELKPSGMGRPVGHSGHHPSDMNAATKGCLAGTAVCFISHQGEVFPCGYLPALAGDLRKQPFAEIWENSVVFNELRDTNNLLGKCGCCEFRNVCMGCRARAYAVTGNYMDEEPFCVYQPHSKELQKDKELATIKV